MSAQAPPVLRPFANCPALDGCHCVTASLAKVFHHAGHPLSEEVLFGLGAGIGFIYWQLNFGGETSIFIGGRGNTRSFYQDLGSRTGVCIQEKHSTSAARAEELLLQSLRSQTPVMVGGDMAYLPWFNFPPGLPLRGPHLRRLRL